MGLALDKFVTSHQLIPLTLKNVSEIYALCQTNPHYYHMLSTTVTKEAIQHDLSELPPGKKAEDKYYLGYYDKEKLIAVLDLITGYPTDKTAWIGFFMLDKKVQHQGIATQLIQELLTFLKNSGFEAVQLGYVKNNQQSRDFWFRQGFTPTGKETFIDSYTIITLNQEL